MAGEFRLIALVSRTRARFWHNERVEPGVTQRFVYGTAWKEDRTAHLTESDAEAWNAMQRERERGRTRLVGVSNVSPRHLEQIVATHKEAPAVVQNRCFARLGWDREVREFCRTHGIVYQGFSLLTANL